MNLEEYQRTGRARYEKLAAIVAELLKRAISAERGYRLQQIQHRAKTVESLFRRIEEIGKLETDEIDIYRKDLAGCRIIFYTNNDVTKFVNSGLLDLLFEVDWKRSRFHQPRPDRMSVDHLFQSYNFVLQLKANRIALLEYRDFEGMHCEVQVQTSLNHAWTEMAHDTIYKQPDLHGFGTRGMQIIEKRLEDAMRKHLLPAGYLFQRIATDVQRLTEGKALFDAGVLDMILTAKNNNDRYDALVRLKEDVLPHYDDLPGVFREVREKLYEAWLVTGKTKAVPHPTPFGGYRGRENHEVTAHIAKILEQYRYIQPDETYAFVRNLYVQTSNAESQTQLVKLAERLASNELHIWECYGPYVQVMLAERLSREQDITSIGPLAIAIASKILDPDITGATSSSSAVTLHRGIIAHSNAIAKARRSVVKTISAYAESIAGNDDALQGASKSLFESGRRPHYGDMSPELATMIFSDLAYAVGRMIKISSKASVSARQDIESQLLHYWRWNKSLPEQICEERNAMEAHKQLLKNMRALRDFLNADEEYVIFKTIVGYKSVFPHQWEDTQLDFNRDEAVRHQRQDELIARITAENWPTWKSRLVDAAGVKSSDLATFPPYAGFLSVMAARHPTLAFELLADRSLLPDWTIRPIACALLDGEMRDDVEALLGQWLYEGRFVREVADVAASGVNVDFAFVSKVASRAMNDADEAACTRFTMVAIRRYAENPKFWKDEIFFPCFFVLQQAEAHEWIRLSWHQPGKDSLFGNLTIDECRVVLEAMVTVEQIDYQGELVLKSIAMKDHRIVLEWFGQRIRKGAHKPDLNFDLVPFSFQSVHEALQPHPRDIMHFVREWFDDDCGERGWHVSHFLSRVYPKFEEPLPSTLLQFIEGANTDDLMFVAFALQGFEGQTVLLPILRTVLASDMANVDVEGAVSLVLHETGVMTGEFGSAQAHQAKVDALRPWLNDENRRVAEFAVREIGQFERIIASENRRAREGIAMRRLDYDEPLDDEEEEENDGTG